MIYELKDNYEKVRPVFKELLEYNLIITAVIEGTSPGRIWVDDIENPRAAFMISPEGNFLSGCSNDEFNKSLKEVIPYYSHLFYYPDTWEEKLDVIWKNKFVIKIFMRYYVFKQLKIDWKGRIPPGFTMVRIDEDFLERTALKNFEDVAEWIEDNWKSPENFLKNGAGFCLIHNETIVSWSLTDCVSGTKCEIGIRTDEDCRRRGLAALTVAAMVEHCLSHGLVHIGWHCADTNVGSYKTAEKVGFRKVLEHPTYISGIPAENASDLGQSEWRELAEFYEQAPETQIWHLYDAACAWALAGDKGRSLDILYRLLDSGWKCDPHTLQEAWPFKGLHGEEEWKKVIATLRKRLGE